MQENTEPDGGKRSRTEKRRCRSGEETRGRALLRRLSSRLRQPLCSRSQKQDPARSGFGEARRGESPAGAGGRVAVAGSAALPPRLAPTRGRLAGNVEENNKETKGRRPPGRGFRPSRGAEKRRPEGPSPFTACALLAALAGWRSPSFGGHRVTRAAGGARGTTAIFLSRMKPDAAPAAGAPTSQRVGVLPTVSRARACAHAFDRRSCSSRRGICPDVRFGSVS